MSPEKVWESLSVKAWDGRLPRVQFAWEELSPPGAATRPGRPPTVVIDPRLGGHLLGLLAHESVHVRTGSAGHGPAFQREAERISRLYGWRWPDDLRSWPTPVTVPEGGWRPLRGW